MVDYTITFDGQWLSLNQVYNKNRYLASKAKNEWKATFTSLFTTAQVAPFTTFRISMRYNSRLDCENTVAGLKIAVDTLREMGLVPNDDKRYYKGVSVEPDKSLPHNRYVLTIHALTL